MRTRRDFIQKSGLIILGAAADAGQAYSSLLPAKPVMIIDVHRCTGCQACVIACKGQAKTAPGRFNTHLITVEKDDSPARVIFTPVQCNQCDDPPCVPVCPNNATFKLANGIVVTDWDKCTSNGNCIDACPYDARFNDQNYGNRVDKCDLCLDRLLQGLEPACVEACASGARIFGDMNNPRGEFAAYHQNNKLTVRKPEEKTGPNVFYVQRARNSEDLI